MNGLLYILLPFFINRSRAPPLDAYFQVSRSQPSLPTTSHDSGASNPVSEDLQAPSSSDSDNESSIEYEEVVVQIDEPEVANLEGECLFRFGFTRLIYRKLRLQPGLVWLFRALKLRLQPGFVWLFSSLVN